ncbi:MFS transporter [Paraburkholderia sp. BCC1886]|uniref:MFS transporter n=1 Tax=Paraburkholderia sp. BCC1886 TaxID=2562670 RepID=UPI001181F301|nr:MFS transporter [Paraburkholderia sp. BCC1886]
MQLAHESTTVGNSRWRRVGLIVFVSYLVAFADRSNIGVAAPLIAHDLGLDLRIIGTLLSAFFWGYVLTQIPGGWIAQRIGPTRVVGCALIVTGIAACLTGLITDLKALLAVRVVLGIAEGVIWPSFAVLFVRWFPGNERGRAVSVAQFAMPASSILMAPIAGWLIDKVHWQAMFVLQGLPAIAMGIVFMWLISDDPATDRRIGEEERQFIMRHRNVDTSENASFATVLRSPVVWLLGVASFCWIMTIFSFGLWMPSLIKQFVANGYTVAGALTALPFVAGAISMYFNARLSDQSTLSRGWFVAVPSVIAGIALIAQHYGPPTLGYAIVMFCIAGAGLYSGAGTWWSWAISMFPRNQAGAAIGLMNIFASFGGIVGPMAVGYFAAGSNAASSFYILGYALFAAAAVMLVLIAQNSRRGPAETGVVYR